MRKIRIYLLALINWAYMTWRCPSLWRNPIQWIMAYNTAVAGRPAWRTVDMVKKCLN